MSALLLFQPRPSRLQRRIGVLLFSTSAKRRRGLRPAWLQQVIEDQSSPPKLFAWTRENLGDLGGRDVAQTGKPVQDWERGARIHVLGIGNLGRLFATSLAQLPVPVPVTLIVHRKALLEQWVANPGIEMRRSGVCSRFTNFDVEWWTDQPPDNGPVTEVCDGRPVSNLIVSTKAPEALPQVDRLRRYLDGTSTVAFVQNGMNKMWPPHGITYNNHRYQRDNHPNWIVCVTTHGVTSLGTFQSLHASLADVAMGPVLLNRSSAQLADYLVSRLAAAPHLDARSVSRSDLWVLQLEKLVVNCVINPLTAVLRCKNGVLFARSDGPIVRAMDALLEEAGGILRSLAQHESTREILSGGGEEMNSCEWDAPRELESRRRDLLERFSTPRLRAMLYSVGERVKENTSSMLQDVEAGKSTEIGDFNGWLVENAGFLGGRLSVENHKTLIRLVKSNAVLEEAQLGEYFSYSTQ